MCSQGDLQQWIPALNHFDAFFAQCTHGRADVQLTVPAAAPDPPFPTAACVAVLRATTTILDNCSNRSLWASHEVRQPQRSPAPARLCT